MQWTGAQSGKGPADAVSSPVVTIGPGSGSVDLFLEILDAEQEILVQCDGPLAFEHAVGRIRMLAERLFAPARCVITLGAGAALPEAGGVAIPDLGGGSLGTIALLPPASGGGAVIAGAAALLPFLARLCGLAARMARGQPAGPGAEENFASLAATIPGVVYQRIVTPEGDIRYTYISEGAQEIFGVSAQEILANPEALFSRHGESYSRDFRNRLLEASRELRMWDVEASIVTRDGREKFTHAIARPKRQADGSVLWTGIILDATRLKEAERAAAATEARTRAAIVESLAQGLLMFDRDDRLIISNSHFVDLFPGLASFIRPGLGYAEIVAAEVTGHGSRPPTEAEQRVIAERISGHARAHVVFERHLPDDRWLMVNEHRSPEGGTVVLYTDVSELKRHERQIHHLAYHDVLTGLANRVQFQQQVEEAVARWRHGRGCTAIFCLDLDHFKNINDTLGHPAGDIVLQVVADRLRASLRSTDTASRLGGDEFAIIITDMPSPDDLSTLAWRILDAMSQPIDLNGQQIVTTVSIGIASTSDAIEETAERLLKNADLALYRAKADGRGTFRFFEEEMDARAQARRALEIDLRSALARHQLELHYQPIVDVYTDEIVAFEALVRWNHPRKGQVPPADFIPLAEETGIIVKLGEWVLREACTTALSWPDTVRVAVNLSPAQFRNRDLARLIGEILREVGLPPNRLELEVTESLLLRDVDSNLATLRALKDIGIRIAMDDFGTGYSSLGNLRSFPFDKIKIDRSFVSDLENNPDSAAIVRAVLSLGRSLGMSTTAEGVETRHQLAYLRAEGCGEVQGFYHSRPRTGSEVDAMLRHGLQKPGPRLRREDALPAPTVPVMRSRAPRAVGRRLADETGPKQTGPDQTERE